MALCSLPIQAQTKYQKPSQAIEDVLRAPSVPQTFTDPTRKVLLQATALEYPAIAEVSRPFFKLAGSRVEPKNRSLHAQWTWTSYTLTDIATGTDRPIALPKGAHVSPPVWAVDGTRFAFTNTTEEAVELYLADVKTASARRVGGVRLNPMLGSQLMWLPDQKALLVKLVPTTIGPAPASDAPPIGPLVQEASGNTRQSSTYELRDTLKSPSDEALFDYYATSQLALVDATSLKVTLLGAPAKYGRVSPSPDGSLLLVQTIHRPYSSVATSERFPREVDVWDREGKLVHHVASQPLADSVPIWGVPTGPRDFDWRPTEPKTLVWAEALDDGDWKTQVPARDRLWMQSAPFKTEPVEIGRTVQRFAGFKWTENPNVALRVEYDAIKHWTKTYLVDVDHLDRAPELLFDHSTDEAYKNPGDPEYTLLPNGRWVVELADDSITLTATGASPEGDRPFADRLNLKTRVTTRFFRSGKAEYEEFVAWIDRAAGVFLTRHEAQTEPPNYFLRKVDAPISDAPSGEAVVSSKVTSQVTHVKDPTPQLRGITKKLVKYKRADGVDLSFTLYLPPGYKEGTKVPAVMWAYPLDYADAAMAGQVQGSPNHFTTIGWPLQLFFLLEGYAVIDDPSLPVVGDTNTIYDTYMEQLVAGAKAAVDKAVELGVDRDRIGVTGHSHGGLMTVNLLANSDLFRAGIARSGAYNRSLTAFGFQNERRTLWQAPEVYFKVSPFFHADQVKKPLLLVHGAADANPGTISLQSETMYEAVRGNGGTVRLVMLPFESHGYRAMESIEHLLWESMEWFGKYVKNAPPRGKVAEPSQTPVPQKTTATKK